MPSRARGQAIDSQVERFHHEMVELIKKYQFRDRNEMTCCGVSVSQCYVLETLHRFGHQTMGDLARRMHLTVSTLTRVVDQLVAKGLANRQADEGDRRFRVIELAARGRAVFEQSWKGVLASEKAILEGFPPSQRDLLIRILRRLNEAVEGWRTGCCDGNGPAGRSRDARDRLRILSHPLPEPGGPRAPNSKREMNSGGESARNRKAKRSTKTRKQPG